MWTRNPLFCFKVTMCQPNIATFAALSTGMGGGGGGGEGYKWLNYRSYKTSHNYLVISFAFVSF